MDEGVLFCTYSLLIQKSTSGKDIRQAMGRNPEGFGHRNILDIYERSAAQEASKGELEFGEKWHFSVALLCMLSASYQQARSQHPQSACTPLHAREARLHCKP